MGIKGSQALERAVEAGKLKSIGLSNYYEPEDFDRQVNATTTRPALLQNETHPYHQSIVMKEHPVISVFRDRPMSSTSMKTVTCGTLN